MTFPDLIAAALAKAGTAAALARNMSVAAKTAYRWKAGISKPPPALAGKLLAYVGLDVAQGLQELYGPGDATEGGPVGASQPAPTPIPPPSPLTDAPESLTAPKTAAQALLAALQRRKERTDGEA